MNISTDLSDDAILAEIGARIARCRLDLKLTQAALAEQAGVSKRTVERIESGDSAQMASLIRVLRVLELLPNLETALPASGPRPLDLLKRKGKQRQRASASRAAEPDDAPWAWDEDA